MYVNVLIFQKITASILKILLIKPSLNTIIFHHDKIVKYQLSWHIQLHKREVN